VPREAGNKEPHPLIEDERFIKQTEQQSGEGEEVKQEESEEKKEGDLSSENGLVDGDASLNQSGEEVEGPSKHQQQTATQTEEEATTKKRPPSEDEILEQNELLHYCFMAALKGGGERKLKDKDLPVLANVFFSDHMLPARPEGTVLNIKRTSYKKLNPFLAEAVSKGLIQTNEPSPGVIQITAVNRSHEQ